MTCQWFSWNKFVLCSQTLNPTELKRTAQSSRRYQMCLSTFWGNVFKMMCETSNYGADFTKQFPFLSEKRLMNFANRSPVHTVYPEDDMSDGIEFSGSPSNS